MTETVTISDRVFEVDFGWTRREPQTWTDPGCEGGPEIDQIWEDGRVAEISDDECDQIVEELMRIAEEFMSDD